MTPKAAALRRRLRRAAAGILAVGLMSAIAIRVFVPTESDDVLADQIYSKGYRHDLELYGGKANLLADEFIRWFSGLWRGPALAVTVACIAGFVSLILLFISRHVGADHSPSDEGDR